MSHQQDDNRGIPPTALQAVISIPQSMICLIAIPARAALQNLQMS